MNQMLYWLHVCICLRLLVWNAGRSHVKKTPFAKKWGGGGKRPPCPTPSAAYDFESETILPQDGGKSAGLHEGER